jgi:hypothetical protein
MISHCGQWRDTAGMVLLRQCFAFWSNFLWHGTIVIGKHADNTVLTSVFKVRFGSGSS